MTAIVQSRCKSKSKIEKIEDEDKIFYTSKTAQVLSGDIRHFDLRKKLIKTHKK